MNGQIFFSLSFSTSELGSTMCKNANSALNPSQDRNSSHGILIYGTSNVQTLVIWPILDTTKLQWTFSFRLGLSQSRLHFCPHNMVSFEYSTRYIYLMCSHKSYQSFPLRKTERKKSSALVIWPRKTCCFICGPGGLDGVKFGRVFWLSTSS